MAVLQLHSRLKVIADLFLPFLGAFCVLSVLGQPGVTIMAANLDYGICCAAECKLRFILPRSRIFQTQRSSNLHGCSSCVRCMGARAVRQQGRPDIICLLSTPGCVCGGCQQRSCCLLRTGFEPGVGLSTSSAAALGSLCICVNFSLMVI